MVEDKITDGKRIAQLLASEITGLKTGSLGAVSITDADPDAMPSDTGTLAFRITNEEIELAKVYLYPAYVELQLAEEPPGQTGDLSPTANQSIVQIPSGAKVKDAVDLINETAATSQPS